MWLAAIAVGLLALSACPSFSRDAATDDWKAPARAAKKQNPVTPDADSIAAGKKMYLANCLACHGATGKGDGPGAVACNPRPKDISDPKIASQTDGELFWKVTEGKKPMPAYDKLLPELDRWKVITYLRTLAPRPTTAPSGG
jgi:mono/diheme cytochrome c family protein